MKTHCQVLVCLHFTISLFIVFQLHIFTSLLCTLGQLVDDVLLFQLLVMIE